MIYIRKRGRLPHWELDNALYFFTYGLIDTLPAPALQALNAERALIETRYAAAPKQAHGS